MVAATEITSGQRWVANIRYARTYCCHWWFSQVSSSVESFSSDSAFSYCLSSTSALASAKPACDDSVTVIAKYGPVLIDADSRTPSRLVSRCSRAPYAYSCCSVESASSPAAIRPSHASAIDGSISVASRNRASAADWSLSNNDMAWSNRLRAAAVVLLLVMRAAPPHRCALHRRRRVVIRLVHRFELGCPQGRRL